MYSIVFVIRTYSFSCKQKQKQKLIQLRLRDVMKKLYLLIIDRELADFITAHSILENITEKRTNYGYNYSKYPLVSLLPISSNRNPTSLHIKKPFEIVALSCSNVRYIAALCGSFTYNKNHSKN